MKKSTKKARTAKSSSVVTKTSSVDDSDDDAFETSAKKTLPSKKLKGTSKVMVDEEDEDMTDLLGERQRGTKQRAAVNASQKCVYVFLLVFRSRSPR